MTQDKDYNLLIASGDFNLSNKVLSKAKDTLVYDKDPENREVKNFEEIFSEYLHHNPLQEDTWIPEYYESDGRVSTEIFVYKVSSGSKIKELHRSLLHLLTMENIYQFHVEKGKSIAGHERDLNSTI